MWCRVALHSEKRLRFGRSDSRARVRLTTRPSRAAAPARWKKAWCSWQPGLFTRRPLCMGGETVRRSYLSREAGAGHVRELVVLAKATGLRSRRRAAAQRELIMGNPVVHFEVTGSRSATSLIPRALDRRCGARHRRSLLARSGRCTPCASCGVTRDGPLTNASGVAVCRAYSGEPVGRVCGCRFLRSCGRAIAQREGAGAAS